MTDLERRIAAAAPAWPAPSAQAEAAAREALGWGVQDTAAATPARRWLRRRGTGRLLLAGAVLVAGGAAATAAIITGGSGSVSAGEPASLDFARPEMVGSPVDWADGLPGVVVDRAGAVTVVWGRAGRIVARTRAAGGAWGGETVLSDAADRSADPAVAIGGDGVVAVVWRQRTAARRVEERFTLPGGAPAGRFTDIVDRRWTVVGRVRDPNGRWGPAHGISAPVSAVRDIEAPDVGVAGDGSVLAVWDQGPTVWAAAMPAGAGDWDEPVRVGAGDGEAVRPVVAVARSGRAVVAWGNRTAWTAPGGLAYTPHAAIRESDGTWETARALAPGVPGTFHIVAALDSDGERAGVLWTQGDGGHGEGARAVMRTGADWTDPEVVRIGADDRFLIGAPTLVLDDAGAAVAFLQGASPPLLRAERGGAWAPVTASGSGRMPIGTMVRDASGRAVAAWRRLGRSDLIVQSVGGSRHGIVGGGGVLPGLAAGADGTTAVVWGEPGSAGAPTRVMVAVAQGVGG